MERFELPNEYVPRAYQHPVWEALEEGCKRAVCIWHRRAGKDLSMIHYCATQAFERVGLYWHLFPTYSQGRKAIWEGRDRAGKKFLEAFPDELVARKRDDDMTLWLKNGSIYQVVGTDHIDRLMGANPVGIIVSEYALQNPAAWDLLRPILAENAGWAVFVYTPRGRNHGYALYQMAKKNKKWFAELLTVEDTDSIPADVIADERETMDEPKFLQEYYCSFDAPLEGSYYGEILKWMGAQDPPRIVDFDLWIPDIPVVTGWDLGWDDATAIWFGQMTRDGVRLIDYEQDQGKPIDHYVKMMREKPYAYGDALLPHDAAQHSLQTGKTTIEQLRNLGVRAMLQPKVPLIDQHNTVRLMLRRAWLDDRPHKCGMGLNALREYSKKPMEGERTPDGEQIFYDQPARNWATHGASALATFFTGLQLERATNFKQPDASYVV